MDSLIAFTAQYVYYRVMALALVYLVIFQRSHWLELLIATVVIGGVAYGLSLIATQLISDPRPFLQTGQPPLIASATDNGFPSDHTLLVAGLAAVVWLVNRWAGTAVAGFALLIGLARVYARVHHLLDVAGSFLIVLIALEIYLIGWEVWRKYRPSPTLTSQPATHDRR